VRKVWEHNGLVEERIYVGDFEVYRKRAASMSNVLLARETLHVMDGEKRVALVETMTADATAGGAFQVSTVTRFQIGNHLGSAMLEVDQGGNVISYEEYHPYGATAYHSGTGAAEVSLKRYRYTGKERDEETGLYYHGARYYACWLGRWTSADPAGMVNGANLYRYVSDRPPNFHDPTGKWEWNDLGRAALGAVKGTYDVIDSTAKSFHPILQIEGHIATALAIGEAAAQEYRASHSVIGAIAQGANQLNPLTGAAIAGIETKEAFKKGDYETAARKGVHVAAGVVNTILIVAGAFRVVRGGVKPAPGAVEPPVQALRQKAATWFRRQSVPEEWKQGQKPPPGTAWKKVPDEAAKSYTDPIVEKYRKLGEESRSGERSGRNLKWRHDAAVEIRESIEKLKKEGALPEVLEKMETIAKYNEEKAAQARHAMNRRR
jgi:RHS repeat-associated protein